MFRLPKFMFRNNNYSPIRLITTCAFDSANSVVSFNHSRPHEHTLINWCYARDSPKKSYQKCAKSEVSYKIPPLRRTVYHSFSTPILTSFIQRIRFIIYLPKARRYRSSLATFIVRCLLFLYNFDKR